MKFVVLVNSFDDSSAILVNVAQIVKCHMENGRMRIHLQDGSCITDLRFSDIFSIEAYLMRECE